jgi:hypothetical protein
MTEKSSSVSKVIKLFDVKSMVWSSYPSLVYTGNVLPYSWLFRVDISHFHPSLVFASNTLPYLLQFQIEICYYLQIYNFLVTL